MRTRSLVILAIVTLLAVAAAVVATRSRAPEAPSSNALLFPGLAGAINDLAQMKVSGQERQVTLAREGDGWFIREEDGYPARLERIRETAIGVSQLKVLAERTSNPELFPRLGVEDPDDKGAASSWLELAAADGKTLAKLVVGKPRHSANHGDVPGLYVRVPGREPVLLVEGRLDVSTVASDWFDRDLADVSADRVRSIEIRHPGGETVRLARDNPGLDLVLADVPEGREPQSAVVLGRMATVLENFFIDGARKAANVTWPAGATSVTLRTFDGLVCQVQAARIDDTPMATLAFSFDATAVVPAQPPDGAEQADAATPATGAAPAGGEDGKDVAAEAARLNEAAANWIFKVPQFKFELLTRKPEDLTRAAGGNAAGSAPPAPPP